MIQPYYRKEKLDVGHSQGLKGEYSWVERGAVKVNGFTQEHNTMTRPGLEPRPFSTCMESSILTTELPSLVIGCNEH